MNSTFLKSKVKAEDLIDSYSFSKQTVGMLEVTIAWMKG